MLHLFLQFLEGFGIGSGLIIIRRFRSRLSMRHHKPKVLSEAEVHRLELAVGVTPEGLQLETVEIIKQIDDELLKLDGIEDYRRSVMNDRLAKLESKVDAQLRKYNDQDDQIIDELTDALKIKKRVASTFAVPPHTIGRSVSERTMHIPNEVVSAMAQGQSKYEEKGFRYFSRDLDYAKQSVTEHFNCECCGKSVMYRRDARHPGPEVDSCPNCQAKRVPPIPNLKLVSA